MLLKKDLYKMIDDDKYIPMLNLVSIPDFTKCIAQFSGLHISKVSDEAIASYLITWAKNKYRFFKLLGNKLQYDTRIKYVEESDDVEYKMQALELEYPAYALWLEEFKETENNKINTRNLGWDVQRMIDKCFPTYSLEGSSLTHFFKSQLKACDDLVTKIGRIYENRKVESNYTISIDPVDMMLASENPYNWVSCYRLANENDGSHADGCIAAILDNSSLITYIWDREGKFSLYGNYDFKSVRYKKMREWIAIAPSMTAIHFNDVYPGKTYSDNFKKVLRKVVENIVNDKVIWVRCEEDCGCYREYEYGYSEYDCDNIWKIKDTTGVEWYVFNEEYICPCGCGNYPIPSHSTDDDEWSYNGEGFIAENFEQRHWCDWADDYCDNESCEDCYYWNREHPVCELDEYTTCQNAWDLDDNDLFDPDVSQIVSCGEHCQGCPLFLQHHPEIKEGQVYTYENAAGDEYTITLSR